MVRYAAAGALPVSRRVAGRAADRARGVAACAGGDVGGVHHVGVRLVHAAGRRRDRHDLRLVARFARSRGGLGRSVARRPFLGTGTGAVVGDRFLLGTGRRHALGPTLAHAALASRRRSALWILVGLAPPLVRRLGLAATSCVAPSSRWATARASCSKRPTARRCSTTPARSVRRSMRRKAVAGYLVAPRHPADRRHHPLARRRRSLQRGARIARAVFGRHGLRVAGDVRLVRRDRPERSAASVAARDRRGRCADPRNLVRRSAPSRAT